MDSYTLAVITWVKFISNKVVMRHPMLVKLSGKLCSGIEFAADDARQGMPDKELPSSHYYLGEIRIQRRPISHDPQIV